MTRGALTSRSLPETPERLALPLDLDMAVLDQELYPAELVERGLGKLSVYPGFAYSGTKSHVLLAACQSQEKAVELRVSDQGVTRIQGCFTHHLLRYLREMGTSEVNSRRMTYAVLVDEVARRMNPAGPAALLEGAPRIGTIPDPYDKCIKSDIQRPHCEGSHRSRIVFSIEDTKHSDSFSLTYGCLDDSSTEEALYVAAGTMHGVVAGEGDSCSTIFTYRHPSARDVMLAPVEVGDSYSKLHIATAERLPWGSMERELKSLHGRRAAISAWGSKPMQVKYMGSTPLRGGLTCCLGLYQVEGDSLPRESADVLYKHAYGRCVLERKDPLALTFAVLPMEVEKGPATIDKALTSIASFNAHLYRQNPCAEVRKQLQVDVQLYPVTRVGIKSGLQSILGPADGSCDLFKDAVYRSIVMGPSTYNLEDDDRVLPEVIIKDTAPSYGLTLVNRSELDLFVSVFSFDPESCSISVSRMLRLGGVRGRDADRVLSMSTVVVPGTEPFYPIITPGAAVTDRTWRQRTGNPQVQSPSRSASAVYIPQNFRVQRIRGPG